MLRIILSEFIRQAEYFRNFVRNESIRCFQQTAIDELEQ